MPTSKGIILAIDQGTTSSRAMAFDGAAREIARAQAEFPQIYPRPGEVEHDPERIWIDTLALSRRTIEEAQGKSGAKVAAIGITNQRETTIVWERATGKVLHNAIVWQDRRTAPLCDKLRADGLAPMIQEKTGLVLDPYFSATKLAWILEHIPNGQARASRGELAFGTIDSFLLWRLTGGKVHATDASNAARTMLFNIRTQSWDDDLLKLFHVPRAVLPDVRDSSGDFGATDPALFGASIAIRGIAGDQQAATFGQAAFEPGMVKSTYGTGCFLLANTGERLVRSQNRLLSTVAWRLKGRVTYAVEGAIFVAGAAVQWVRDGLRLIGSASESEALARSVTDTGGVYLVPAFTGLGAPYWDADARGALLGLTRATGAAEIARATLESIAYQTRDLTEAMAADGAPAPAAIRVDGGLVANNFAMQFLADMLGTKIERPVVTETTALGAAYLAGMACGVYGSQAEIAQQWRRERLFEPAMDADQRMRLYNGWKAAISRVRST